MLTLKECLDYCDLSEAEIAAIAEHEHIPMIVAAELGNSLLQSHEGVKALRHYIIDDINQAQVQGQALKALHLHQVLNQFDAAHPSTG